MRTYELSTYTTFPDKTMINYSLGKNKTAVFLDWSDIPNAIKYDIYLDGVLIAETRSSHFTHNLDEKNKVFIEYSFIYQTPMNSLKKMRF